VIAVDLFCGAGGASLGLHRAGYTVTGFDYWRPAVGTHNANGLPAHVHDLSDPDLDGAIPSCGLLWASPPCQPFSAAGDGEGEFDDRDGFPWTLRIIGRLLPPVVIIENVKGLTFEKHRDYFGRVLAELSGLGYTWQWRVLNAADYGVPQTRERCFIIARRDDGPIVWPAPTHTQGESLFLEPWVTMAQALGWADSDLFGYRRGEGVSERHGERGSSVTTPAPTIHCNSEKDAFRIVLDRRQNGAPLLDAAAAPSPTVTGVWSQWTVNDAIRLTITELATLQGFPDDWQWTGTKTAQARCVGNAVPPIMAEVLATANRPLEVNP
jgi:DNA (cytosine-5)-methyltransferase 1